jgi:ribosomal protein L14
LREIRTRVKGIIVWDNSGGTKSNVMKVSETGRTKVANEMGRRSVRGIRKASEVLKCDVTGRDVRKVSVMDGEV